MPAALLGHTLSSTRFGGTDPVAQKQKSCNILRLGSQQELFGSEDGISQHTATFICMCPSLL